VYGWMGKILEVNLDNGKISQKTLEKELATGYLGGRGINMRLIFDLAGPQRVDPLGPDNPLVFGAGPLIGTLSPCSGRFNISARRGMESITIGDSNAGGYWGPELKFAGFDHVVIVGRSKNPVYLLISDNHAELKDATHLWGKTTSETVDIILEDNGDPGIHVACIGPGGENLVSYACVIADRSRAAGRTGMGCVMGSKKLKAIAVHGTQGVKIAKPELFEKAVEEALNVINSSVGITQMFSNYGTLFLVTSSNPGGHFTTRNSQTGTFEGAEYLMPDYVFPRYWIKHKGCFNCPIHCTQVFEVDEGGFKGLRYDKIEYNTLYDFGSNIGNSYWPAILKAGQLCNEYGLNIDGVGYSIAWAMECFEKGLINKKDTDEFDLSWGNYQAVMELINKIAMKEGFGDVLAEAPARAARRIGRGTEKYVHAIKGMTLYGDMRARQGWGLAYCVSTRGPDHLRGSPQAEFYGGVYSPEEVQRLIGVSAEKLPIKKGTLDPLSLSDKAPILVWTEHLCTIADAAGICKIPTGQNYIQNIKFPLIARLVSAATGIEIDEVSLEEMGERIYNLERVMNAVDGITRKDEVLPPRQYEPLPSGPKKGVMVDPMRLEKAKDEYYQRRGWDSETGLPTKKKLEELGMKDVAEQLAGVLF